MCTGDDEQLLQSKSEHSKLYLLRTHLAKSFTICQPVAHTNLLVQRRFVQNPSVL